MYPGLPVVMCCVRRKVYVSAHIFWVGIRCGHLLVKIGTGILVGRSLPGITWVLLPTRRL
jgi:hypothetical protein